MKIKWNTKRQSNHFKRQDRRNKKQRIQTDYRNQMIADDHSYKKLYEMLKGNTINIGLKQSQLYDIYERHSLNVDTYRLKGNEQKTYNAYKLYV